MPIAFRPGIIGRRRVPAGVMAEIPEVVPARVPARVPAVAEPGALQQDYATRQAARRQTYLTRRKNKEPE